MEIHIPVHVHETHTPIHTVIDMDTRRNTHSRTETHIPIARHRHICRDTHSHRCTDTTTPSRTDTRRSIYT